MIALFARLIVGFVAIAVPPAATQAQTERMHRVGLMCPPDSTQSAGRLEGFYSELGHQGFVVGKDLTFVSRGSPSDSKEAMLRAANELVQAKVDVIVTWCGTTGALAAKQSTDLVPIVFHSASDPVERGLVASLARPGANVTGTSSRSHALIAKSLEIAKQAMPNAARGALVHDAAAAARPSFPGFVAGLEAGASAVGLSVQLVAVPDGSRLEATLRKLRSEKVDFWLLYWSTPEAGDFLERVVKAGLTLRLPCLGEVTAGCLLAVDYDSVDIAQRTARYTARVLRGAKPAELPVEQEHRIRLSVNLKTARAIGLTVPRAVFLRADRVIE